MPAGFRWFERLGMVVERETRVDRERDRIPGDEQDVE